MTPLQEFVNSDAVLIFCAIGIAMCIFMIIDIIRKW